MTKSRRRSDRADFGAGLFDELVVDNFAGGGGASLGIERALGRAVDVAINHDRQAVALHTANHPHTRHHCEDVWTVDPVEATGGRPVGLAWFSPDCKHFSRAKGGKPVSKKIRGLAWVVIKWARAVRPRVIMLENVREFETWGPLVPAMSKGGIALVDKDGRPKMVPCPLRKGRTFRRWLSSLRGLGYEVQHRTLDAADYGAPTHRKRLFLIARCDGAPIVWPEPTHGPGRCKPWRTAAECIDWSLPCPSIFLTEEEGKKVKAKRPLEEKTMRRIAMGLKRYVLDNPRPFIVRVNHGGPDFRGQDIGGPLSTVTQRHGYGVVAPFFTAQYGERTGQPPRSHRADGPFPTVTPRAGGGFPLVEAALRIADDRSASVEAPLGTVTSVARPHLIAPSLVQYNQEKGGEVRGKGLGSPLNVVPTENRHGLVAASLTKYFGGVVGQTLDRPLPTITAIDHSGVVAASLTSMRGGSVGQVVDRPLPTQTAMRHEGVVAANLIKMNFGDKQWSPVDEPLRTILAGANHHGLVAAFLTKYFGSSRVGQTLAEPLHTVTSRDRFGLVMVGGEPYEIADIGLRMLSPRELYRAQGFPEDYRIDVEISVIRKTKKGERVVAKRLCKAAQTRMCGNSVCPPVAEALVRANVVEVEQTTTLEMACG